MSQTYDNIEYIYVDDGATDGTKDVVLSYKDKFESRGIPFMYVYKENGGLCSAIQEGLQHVNGECLCWPEYDDILLPTAIEERVKYLESHSDCAVVTCDAWITPVDSLDKPTGVLSYHNPNRFDRNHFVQLLTGNSIFTAACHMVRMDVFDETHKDRKIFQSRVGAVWQMLVPIYYKYNRGFIDKPLVKWVHISSAVPCHATQGRNSFVSLSFTFSLHATRKLHTVVPFCVALRSGSEQSRPCKIILFTIFFLLTNSFFRILAGSHLPSSPAPAWPLTDHIGAADAFDFRCGVQRSHRSCGTYRRRDTPQGRISRFCFGMPHRRCG